MLKSSAGKTIKRTIKPVDKRLKKSSSAEMGMSLGPEMDATIADLAFTFSSGVGVGVSSGVGVGDSSGSSVGSSVTGINVPVVGRTVGRVVGLGVGVGVFVGAGADVAGGEVGAEVGTDVGAVVGNMVGVMQFGLFGFSMHGSLFWAKAFDVPNKKEKSTSTKTDNTLFMHHYYNELFYKK